MAPSPVPFHRSASYNEDAGFSTTRREAYKVRGLVPPVVESIDTQVKRALGQLRGKPSPIEKYIFLSSLRQTNSKLFYRLLVDNMQECCPIVYTPTVGEACQRYSHIYRRPDCLFLSYADKGHLADVMRNWPDAQDVRIAVVTDGSRILGLGDLGVGGNQIAVGKLSLYIAAAGIRPSSTLPIVLDVGTNNEANLNDALYMGLRQKRISQAEMDEFMDEFYTAARAVFPRMHIQFEDFSTDNAFRYLARYRSAAPEKAITSPSTGEKFGGRVFNDDIQGTGSVILGGFINAAKLSAAASSRELLDQRIVFLGAGSAGVGVAQQLAAFFTNGGMSAEEAKRRFYLVDTKGLVTDDRGDKMAEHKKIFSRPAGDSPQLKTLLEIIEHVRPTALIGLSTVAGAFDETVVRKMAEINPRPIVFPLSNPVHLSECSLAQAVEWTDGKVIFASGSPFAPATAPDGRTIEGNQGNNMYVFPGLGLGAILSHSKEVTDRMVEASATALSESLNAEETSAGLLYPRLTQIRDISALIARAVIRAAQKDGVDGEDDKARALRSMSDDDLLRFVQERQFNPAYEQ